MFRIVKNYREAEPEMDEFLRLEFIKVIGFTHMRILKGMDSLLQLHSLVAQLCTLPTAIAGK